MSVEQIIHGITRETLSNLSVAELPRERDGTEASIAAGDQLLEWRREMITLADQSR